MKTQSKSWQRRSSTPLVALTLSLIAPFAWAQAMQCRTVTALNSMTLGCNSNEVMVSGGASCHAEWDDHLAESRPTGIGQLEAKCVNHNNSGRINPPATITAVCCPASQFPGARLESSTDQASISCGGDLMVMGGAACHSSDWDQRLVTSLPSPGNPLHGMDFMCMTPETTSPQAEQSANAVGDLRQAGRGPRHGGAGQPTDAAEVVQSGLQEQRGPPQRGHRVPRVLG